MHLQIRQSADPVSSTADVWSALVANIAPLLILVGEKHVKAYFKMMCRTSHHLLFAAAPIGLVTAVTTLIRLNGSDILKRMIGRQFETRAELLADLTSVSCGEVGLELIGMNLEQTINTSEEDLAMIWVHGKKVGSAEEVVNFLDGVSPRLMSIAHRSVASTSADYQPRCAWSALRSFRAKGPGAVWLARNYAAQTDSGQRTLKEESQREVEQLDPNGVTTCEGVAVVYARWSDVSLILTASANLDAGRLEILRYATVVICQAGNVGIIIASWFTGHDPRNVGLVAAGLFISSAGSWLTAWLVDQASREEVIDLAPLSAFASGFYSKRFEEGLGLSFSPQKVVISTDTRPARSNATNERKLLPSAAVGIMVMAYIGLYLGLRASAWWVSLSMLANAAIAGLARSVLVPTSLYLSPVPGDGRTPNPLFESIRANIIARDMKFPEPQPLSASQTSLSTKQKQSLSSKQPGFDFLKEPVIINDTYEVAYGEPNVRDDFVSPARGNLFEMVISLTLACEMRRRNIAPLEMSNWQKPKSPKILYSDLISRGGVWRQPLEVILPFNSVRRPEDILASFRCWHGRAYDSPAQKIADLSLDPQIASKFTDLENDEGRVGSITEKFRSVLEKDSGRAKIWMMTKIIFAAQYEWEINKLEDTATSWYEMPPGNIYVEGFNKQQQSLLLDSITAAGLTFSSI